MQLLVGINEINIKYISKYVPEKDFFSLISKDKFFDHFALRYINKKVFALVAQWPWQGYSLRIGLYNSNFWASGATDLKRKITNKKLILLLKAWQELLKFKSRLDWLNHNHNNKLSSIKITLFLGLIINLTDYSIYSEQLVTFIEQIRLLLSYVTNTLLLDN